MQEYKSKGFSNDNLEVEVTLRGEAENRLDLIVKGIEHLVSSIDVKHMCNEDHLLFSKVSNRLFLSIADMVGFEHYYWDVVPETEKKYNEYEELVVSEKAKVELLKRIVDELGEKLKQK